MSWLVGQVGVVLGLVADGIMHVVIEIKFETGEGKLKALEDGVFIGAGRFIVEKDRPVVVEYKISQVVKGS